VIMPVVRLPSPTPFVMKTKFVFGSLILILCVAILRAAENPMDQFRAPQVSEPKIPGAQVSIKDFGAVPDGKTLNTEAIAKAIGALADKGGGRVVVPPGLWL